MQKNLKRLSISFLFILLGGCATSYKPIGFSGGYSEMALSEDTYIVSFSGNGFTSADSVQANLLRRCADLTISKGYKYFIIASGNTSVNSSVIQTPTRVNVNSNSSYQGYGSGSTNFYGNRAYSNFNMRGNESYNSYTTINPGQQYQINKYSARVSIKMLNTKTEHALDARVILSNFR